MKETPITLHNPAPDEGGLRADLDELRERLKTLRERFVDGGHTVVDIVMESPTELRIGFEADSEEARDRAVRDVVREWRAAVSEYGDEHIESIAVEIQRADAGGAVVFTIQREWLPSAPIAADREAWSEMLDRVNDTHEVIGGE